MSLKSTLLTALVAAAFFPALPAQAENASLRIFPNANTDCTFTLTGDSVTFANDTLRAPAGTTVTLITTKMAPEYSVRPVLYTASGSQVLLYDRIENNLPVFTFTMPSDGQMLRLPYQKGNLIVGGVYFVGIENAYKALTPENNVLTMNYSYVQVDSLPKVPCTFQGTDGGIAIGIPEELSLNADVTFNHCSISGPTMRSKCTMYANGHKLVLGPRTTGPQYYSNGWQNLLTVYGGSGEAGATVESADVTVTGIMNLAALYGGGKNSDVSGEARLTISGCTVTTVCGGGDGGSVGSSTISISRQNTYPNEINNIYGVSATPGSKVTGDVTFNLDSADIWFIKGIYAAGPDDSETVGGDVTINSVNTRYKYSIPFIVCPSTVAGQLNVALNPRVRVNRWATTEAYDDNTVAAGKGLHITLDSIGTPDAPQYYSFPKGLKEITLTDSHIMNGGGAVEAPFTVDGTNSAISGKFNVDAPSAAEAIVTLKPEVALDSAAAFVYGDKQLEQFKPGSDIYCIITALPKLIVSDPSIKPTFDESRSVTVDSTTYLLPGTEITLSVASKSGEDVTVTLNGQELKPGDDGKYSFVIPAEGADVGVIKSTMMVGIDTIGSDGDAATAKFYTISGVEVSASALTPGIYIRVADGKATKVMIR